MPKKYYLPRDDAGKAALFLHVKDTLPQFFAALGLTALTPEVQQQARDADLFDFMLDQQQRLVAAAQQATNAKDRLRDGDPANPGLAVSLAFPGAPAIVPSPGLPGLVARFLLFVRFLRGRTGYTEAIGEALKIVGDEQAASDPATAQPVITLRHSGGRVEVIWVKHRMGALEIWVDRGDGLGFVFLTIDSVPNYIDTQPFPAAPAKWKYKAIYRLADERVGQWSAIAETMVG